METQSIVVLDFGAQYSQLIARRIRELNVFSAVIPCNASLDEIRSYSPIGIILSGGPSSVYDKDAPVTDPGIFDLKRFLAAVPALSAKPCYVEQESPTDELASARVNYRYARSLLF